MIDVGRDNEFRSASVELFRESAIEAVFNVEEGAENTELDLYLAVYHLNGSFLGMHSVRKGFLQICPSSPESAQGAFEFGRLYYQSCRLDLQKSLLKIQEMQSQFDASRSTVFYELYIRYTTNNGQKMVRII